MRTGRQTFKFARGRMPHLSKRQILSILAAMILAICAGLYSVARIVETARPDLALSIMPTLPPALTAKSDALIAQSANQPNDAKVAKVRNLAQRALRSTALSPEALRTIAVTDPEGSETSVPKLLGMALRVSRRDVGTQLLQIELDVARGNIPATLRHYDQALRVRPSVGGTLYPVLLSATENPEILVAAKELVATDPQWLDSLVRWTIENPAHIAALSRLIGAIPRQSEAMATGFGQALVEALVARKEYAPAFAVYQAYSRNAEAAAEGFTYRPIDWTVADNYDSGADLILGKSPKIRIFAESGSQGVFLFRLAHWDAGRYQLVFDVEALAANSRGVLKLLLSCQAGDKETPLSQATFNLATGRYSHMFTVPNDGCPFQWARFSILSINGAIDANLANIRVQQVGQRAP